MSSGSQSASGSGSIAVAAHRDALLARLGLDEVGGAEDDVAERRRLRTKLTRPSELEQLGHHALDAVDLGAKELEELARLLVLRLERPLEQLRGAAQHAERRAHLVGDARGELADERELRRVDELAARHGRRSTDMRLNAEVSVPISSPERSANGRRGPAAAALSSSAAAVSSASGRVVRRAAKSAMASATTSVAPRAAPEATRRPVHWREG